MYKTGNIISYLKSDNYKEFHRFAQNKISLSDITERFNVSNQLALNAIKLIDANIMDKREDNINYRLEVICDMIFEGVPIDYILEQTEIGEPLNRSFTTTSFNSRKDAIIAKIKRRGIHDDKEIRKYVMITNKLKNYISIIQIENEILRTSDEDLNFLHISYNYGVSYTKVLERNQNIKKHGRAITTIDDALYDILKRNIAITERYIKGDSLTTLRRENKDLKYLNMIVETYQPYIKVVN